MNDVKEFERRDWLTAVVLFVVAVCLYSPFRSRMAYHWDSAEFTVAIHDYNVALGQPHAPGYFLYVMLGRLVNWFVGDPHASLVWVSVMAGAGLVATVYLLGTAMFGRRTGIAAGLFTMSSPLVWFHSCVALTYVVDGFLVCLTVLMCWRAMNCDGSLRDAVVIGILIAAVGGVRQQTVPALVPLIVFTFWNSRNARLAKLSAACATGVLLGLAWFLPMVEMSGGLAMYMKIVGRHIAHNAPSTALVGGWDAIAWNLFFILVFCADGLMLGLVLLAGALIYRVVWCDAPRKKEWTDEHARALWMLAIWVISAMACGIIEFTRQPGYVLSYLPGLLILAAVAAAQLRKSSTFITVTAAVCLINASVFLAWPRDWDGVFFGLGRTAREIREHDTRLRRTVQLIRSRYLPSETIICHAQEYLSFGMRHFQLYLPEFDQYQLALDDAVVSPKGNPIQSVRDGRWQFVGGIEHGHKRVALLVVPPGSSVDIFKPYFDTSGAQEASDSGGTVFEMPLDSIRFKSTIAGEINGER